jgi:murein peptide amidase A
MCVRAVAVKSIVALSTQHRGRRRGRNAFDLVVLGICGVLAACSGSTRAVTARPADERKTAPVHPYVTTAGKPHRSAATMSQGTRSLPGSTIIGYSVNGIPIRAVEIGNPNARRDVVVVGCIHGDEPAGIAIARALEREAVRPSVDLWIIEDLNPDGVAAHTRQNAHRVDLNRNFPDSWRRLGRPGDDQYSGTGPLSEPESRAAAAFLRRLHPALTIWFHQHAALVDESGADVSVEARFARAIGLPLRQLIRYPGSAATWENHQFAGSTAFVVELPAGPVPAARLGVFTRAILS